ncbi:hypothetical protein CcaCcLH18_13629 [Colletotrichum camelliae]|nr:hypothetical protein CcaCcLH18_13629 [Colletotrichum camelliae]
MTSPLDSALDNLNTVEAGVPSIILSRSWLRLRTNFVADCNREARNFELWAFCNVQRPILRLVADELYLEQAEGSDDEANRHWSAVARLHDVSIPILVMLFGADILASRQCAQATTNLLKARLDVNLAHICHRYVENTSQIHCRSTIKAFRAAIDSYESGSIPPSLEPAPQLKNSQSSPRHPLNPDHAPIIFRSNDDVCTPTTGRGLKRNLDESSSEKAQKKQKTPRSRLSLPSILGSMHRLGSGTWIDDVIMFVFGCRLVSDNVGFIDSLTISSLTRTERARLNLQETMCKDTVLLFYNQDNEHWVLFVYTRRDSTLREYNSFPSASSNSCTGNEEVPNFLRWANNDRNLRIRFQRSKCAEQPNGFDCGIYVLIFADCIATGVELPTTVDGPSYRKYLQSSLFTSAHSALRPDELVAVGKHIPHTTNERAAQLKDLTQRRRCLMELCKSYENTSDTASRKHAELLWRRDRHRTNQSVLAGLIHCILNTHQAALDAALASQSKFERDANMGFQGRKMDGTRAIRINATLAVKEYASRGFLGPPPQETCRQTTRN